MFEHVTSAINALFPRLHQKVQSKFTPFQYALAGLLSEVAYADDQSLPIEESVQHGLLMKLFQSHGHTISESELHELMSETKSRIHSSTSIYQYTDKLRLLTADERFNLIKAMWEVAYADGHLDPIEEMIIRKTAALIYLEQSLFIKAKLEAQNSKMVE